MPLFRIAYFLPLALLFACSTKKNTFVTRTFHNITARYNGYYYSCENISEGVYKIEKTNKDNYERILPVYIYPTSEKAKATFPEFDKAIKKSSLCIQRHTIKDKKGHEIPTAGKWIDNNWINIGVAHFYKREFFSAIEAFEYVVRTYKKSEDKYTAMLWLIKTNNEIGAVSSSEQMISLLKNETGLPWRVKNELPIATADYYLRRGQNAEAITKLTEVNKNTRWHKGIGRSKRARYSFIKGQLSELTGDPKKAVQYYRKTIKLKPSYEMVFYSKIKIARLLDVKRTNSEKTKKELLRMTKEFKNADYYDVIYYTLGEISEKERKTDEAIGYYKKSVQTSVINPSQKASSFLKLGEINFARTYYEPAEAYYDSALATLPKDHPDFNSILARKKTLETLVDYISTISREDSLQKIARMPEAERLAFVDKVIEEHKKQEERKRKEIANKMMESSSAGVNNTLTPQVAPGLSVPEPGSGGATFYFYNPNTVALGIADFNRKWGNRKLEDHWRRSNKTMNIEESVEEVVDTNATAKNKKKDDPAVAREFYLKNLPMSDSSVAKSNTKIVRAYYLMGVLYKEELNNPKKTIVTFEELNNRFPKNKFELKTYYTLYRVYQSLRDQEKAEYYKNKILGEYPDSEFALLIKNPEYATELNTQKSEVEKFYVTVYEAYQSGNYGDAYSKADDGLKKFGSGDYADKFEFIRSMSAGKIKGVDTLEKNLKLLVAKYPKSDVTPLAQDILQSINTQKNPPKFKPNTSSQSTNDTFTVNFDNEHYIFAIMPDNAKMIDAFKSNVTNFNTLFFSEKQIGITSSLFGSDKQIVVLKSFPNAREAVNYYDNLMADNDVFKGDVKRDLIEIYPIMPSNMAFLYQRKSAAAYKLFYADHYKKLKETN